MFMQCYILLSFIEFGITVIWFAVWILCALEKDGFSTCLESVSEELNSSEIWMN